MSLRAARALVGVLLLLGLTAAGLAAAVVPPGEQAPAKRFPAGFFGVGLAEQPSATELERMHDGGVESVRFQLYWPAIEPADGDYRWETFDAVIADAAREGIEVLPVVNGTPDWLAPVPTVLPVQEPAQRRAWTRFLAAAAARYGPDGAFWHARPSVPALPVTAWQIWNEPNFFYFAEEVSTSDYARLVEAARTGLDRADPGARLILGGLFGRPPRPGPQAVPAAEFLDRLYRVVDRDAFDAVALHPYSTEAERIGPLIAEFRRVLEENGDGGRELWITELGWGSGIGSGFEKGVLGQVEELTIAYELLRRRGSEWRVRAAYWFAWQDAGGCDFCDSTGLTRDDGTFKPAWDAFREFAER